VQPGNEQVDRLSAELRDELANSYRRKVVDPRTVPCRFSTLKQFALSPLHYWHACQGEFEETLSMRIGSGGHAVLFDQPIAIWDQPAKKGSGKAPRSGAAWDEFKQENAGKTILNVNEKRQGEKIANAIRRHPIAMRVLFADNTTHEQRIDWTWDGREFRSTPDALGVHHLVDLKCLKSADPERVMWQSRSMNYHAQAALYRRAVLEKFNRKLRDCFLVVVENKEPYPVTVLRFSERALDMGDRSCVTWNELRRVHEEANEWPGYVQNVVELDLPGEEDIDDLGLTFADESEEVEAA
jgi:hypothetical protein